MTLKELGKALQEKRETTGMTIDDVAARIKVSTRILRTIENGTTEGLPHSVYTKSFVKSFGHVIGYDADELSVYLEELFPPEFMDETKKEHMSRSRPVNTTAVSAKPIGAIVLVLLVLGVLGGGGWYVATNYGDNIVDFVKQSFSVGTTDEASGQTQQSRTPQEQQRAAPAATTAPSAQTSSASGSAHAATAPLSAVQQSAKVNSESVSQAAPVAQETPVSVRPSSEEAPQQAESTVSTPAPEAPLVVEIPAEHQMLITARRSCWVGATIDDSKEKPFTLKPGQQRSITYTKSLVLVLGNPTGVNLVHDGENLGSPAPGSRALHFPPQAN